MTNTKNKLSLDKNIKTRDKIISVAEKLFSKYHYHSVSLNEIAKKVNISKATLYHYFENKEALYLEILDKAHQKLCTQIIQITKENIKTKEKIKKILKTSIEFKLNNKSFSGLIMQKVSKKDTKIIEFTNNLKNKITKKLEPIFEEINSVDTFPANTDKKLIIFLIMAQMHAYVLNKKYFHDNNWTVDQVVDQIIYSLFK